MAGYTRQSSYTDGDVINAADSNNEFNQILSAFVNTSGHKHDGTAAEGPVIGLIGDPGVATPLNKVVVDDTNNRVGVFVDAGGAGSSVEQLRFQDGAIVPVTNNDVDLGTSSLEFKDAFFDGTVTTDALAAGTANIDGGSIDGATLGTNSAITQAVIDNVNINGATIGHTDDTDLITLADGIATVAGEISVTTLDIGGTNVTSTAAELNIMDGDTSATSTTVADADRVVFNDAGTMKQVAVTDLAAYFDDEITAMPNLVTTAATTVGALNSGSITSGFGTIDTGSSTITTTGLITGGSLDIDDVVINGSTIGHTDDTDLITVADGIATVAGEVSMTTLDIGGTNVTATAAELNYNDTGASVGTVVASKVVTVDANKDAANFRNITLTGELDAGSLDVSGDADIDGTLEADAITVNGTALSTVIAGTTVANATLAATATVTDSTANTNFPVVFHDESNGLLDDTGAFRYNPSTGELLVSKLNVSGTDLFVSRNVDVDGTLEADAMTLNGTAITATATLDTGISNNNIPKFTSGVADNDFLRVDGTAIEGRSASEVLSDIGGQASLTFGISNTNAVKIDSSSVADDEFARFTANGLESRSATEVRSDIGLGTAAVAATGISNGNVAVFTSGAADNDFLRIDGTSIEGRSASEVLSDIGATTATLAAEEATALAIALG